MSGRRAWTTVAFQRATGSGRSAVVAAVWIVYVAVDCWPVHATRQPAHHRNSTAAPACFGRRRRCWPHEIRCGVRWCTAHGRTWAWCVADSHPSCTEWWAPNHVNTNMSCHYYLRASYARQNRYLLLFYRRLSVCQSVVRPKTEKTLQMVTFWWRLTLIFDHDLLTLRAILVFPADIC